MQRMIKIFFLLVSLLLFTACGHKQTAITHSLPKGCDYYSMKQARCLGQQEVTQALAPYSVLFVGDHHTEADMHQKLADLITLLSQNGTKVVLAHEWFYPRDEKVLSDYVNSDINETQFIERINWKKRLSFYDFDSFKPIYSAVIKSGGRIHGINLTQQERKRISDQNLSSMHEDEKSFYAKLDLDVYPHQELIMPYLQHCHAPKPGEETGMCQKRMYRVQVAWDTKMADEAYTLASTLKRDEKLLVFAGSLHMENNLGIPLRFTRLSTLPSRTIIPVKNDTEKVSHGLGDFLLYYQPELKP